MTNDSSEMPQHVLNDILALTNNNTTAWCNSFNIATTILCASGCREMCMFVCGLCPKDDNIDESVCVCTGRFTGLCLRMPFLVRMLYRLHDNVGVFLYYQSIFDIVYVSSGVCVDRASCYC